MNPIILCLFLIFSAGCSIHKKSDPAKGDLSTQRKHLKHKSHDIAHRDNKYNAKTLANAIFGQNGANLPLQDLLKVKKLLADIQHLTLKQQHQIASYTAHILSKEVANYPQDKQHLILYVIEYLHQFAHHQEHTSITNLIKTTAQQIIEYIHLECEQIFTKPKEKYYFLAAQRGRKLPSLINFWTNPHGEKVLQTQHTTNDQVETQGIIMDMGIMVGTQMGATLANDSVNTEEKQLEDSMTAAGKAIQANIKGFQSNAQSRQQKELQSVMTAFSTAEKQSQQNTKNAQETSQAEQLYLYKNISIQKPQTNYLFGQIDFDQLFSLGTMLTPTGAVWKNPFAVGDWEYDSETNSFWQNQISDVYATAKGADGSQTKSDAKAANNSIFTEYFTNKAQYNIAGEITIYKVSYPFVAGIMFNKARWISGDIDNLRKCRMLAIYGTSSSDLGVYFAEQYTLTDAQIKATKSTSPTQTPLQQILNKKVAKKVSISKNAFKNISFEPVTFKFSIETSPTAIAFKLWNATQAEPKTSINISQLDLHLFIYNGIGFICPGAVAEFKLTQPEDLVFSSEAIENYKKEVVA